MQYYILHNYYKIVRKFFFAPLTASTTNFQCWVSKVCVSVNCNVLIAFVFSFGVKLHLNDNEYNLEPAAIAKSTIIYDVKPWDDETDMAELEKCVRSVTTDGLVWGACKCFLINFYLSAIARSQYGVLSWLRSIGKNDLKNWSKAETY